MVILVTDTGFHPDDWRDGFVPLAAVSDQAGATLGQLAIDLADPECTAAEWARLTHLLPRIALIRIRLRRVGDIAGIALATSLRCAGYTGRIRAHGAVLAAHYTLFRRAGFTEVELQPHQAQRQPSEHWHNNACWSLLRGSAHRFGDPGERTKQNGRSAS